MTAPAALPAAPPVTNTAPAEWVQPPDQQPATQTVAAPAQIQMQQPQQAPPMQAPPQTAQPPAQNVQPPQTGYPQQQAPTQPAPVAGGWATPPPPAPSWDTKAHIGATCLVVVHKVTHGVMTQYGMKTMVDATVVELLGPMPGVYDDIQFYNTQLVGQLEGLVGMYTLGRFALGQGKGATPPTVLNPPTEQDGVLAQQWFNENPGKMEELQRLGKLQADQPKPPPQQPQNQWQQPGPMQGQQWQNSPTQGGYPPPPQQYGQNPYPQPNGQPQQPYPWQQQGQPTNGQQAWQQPAAAQQNYGSYPGQGQPDQPPF
jgi:hypothetical protein